MRLGALAAGAIAVLAALLAIAPLTSLAVIAFGSTGDLWQHLIRYVMPVALVQTALLLAGVAAVTIVIGVGAAWAVTTFQFPGRDTLAWMLVLPLAIPTYIVAYIYVDLLDSYGPVQSALRAAFGWKSAADYWFPSVRSLGGAILLMGLVLYPYVYLAARAMFQTQAAQFAEAARVLGARPFRLALQISLPLARPAIAVGVALALLETLNDIGAQRISRRADADAVDLHHLAQPQQPARRGADRLRDAGLRRRADCARALRPARPRVHGDDPAGRALLRRASC